MQSPAKLPPKKPVVRTTSSTAHQRSSAEVLANCFLSMPNKGHGVVFTNPLDDVLENLYQLREEVIAHAESFEPDCGADRLGRLLCANKGGKSCLMRACLRTAVTKAS